ncbi:hypothetical protein H9Q13_09285 [Pontibacter sp. JH31]|uniref:DUF5668 domain-containing protein n=1 Tax=Pontibacter aquaedesilientis TaxID=2766980 RepID=A0ABR7XGF5_9BACT|nr:hypothetical protein [Pontibacter aquaedesilientis]MBD1397356.1 hypothetical protein [Pontibacter aquaedesilientis]
MGSWNKYYKISFWGAIATLLMQIMVTVAVDMHLAAMFTPIYPVWGIFLVVGWRKEHPRR